MNRRRPKLRSKIGWALAGLVPLGLALTAALTATSGLPTSDFYEVSVQFKDLANLDRYSEVRIAGKRVGQVRDVGYVNGVATATLQLDPNVRPLPADTGARIRYKSLVGAKLVELRPGNSSEGLPEGATIPVARTSTAVELSSILSTFDERRREELQTVVAGLGTGMLNRGEGLNDTLKAAVPLSQDITNLSSAVNARKGAARRLAPSVSKLTGALRPVSDDLAQTFSPAAKVFAALTDERTALEDTLAEAPPALEQAQAGLHASEPLLDEAIALSHQVKTLTRSAPDALDATAGLMHAADAPLRRTQPLLRQLSLALPPTSRLVSSLDPLVVPTRHAFGDLLPIFDTLGPRACDIRGALANLHDVVSFSTPRAKDGDELSILARAEFGANQSVVGDIPRQSPPLLGHNPYPKPCEALHDRMPELP